MIQCLVQRGTQATGVRPRRSTPPVNTQQTASVPNSQITENGGTLDSERDKLPKQEGEAFIPATSKKLIKLDECDVSTENSLRNIQQQGAECKYREHSQNSRITQQQTRIEKGQVQQNEYNINLHSNLQEDS